MHFTDHTDHTNHNTLSPADAEDEGEADVEDTHAVNDADGVPWWWS